MVRKTGGAAADVGWALLADDVEIVVVVTVCVVVVVDCGVAVGNAGCDCANESVVAAAKRKAKDRFFT